MSTSPGRCAGWPGQPRRARAGQTYVSGRDRAAARPRCCWARTIPALVHGVIASIAERRGPCAVPTPAPPGSAAWTLDGRARARTRRAVRSARTCPPTTPAGDHPGPGDPRPGVPGLRHRRRALELLRVRAGIERHLTAARFAYPHVVYRYQGAGHLVDTLVAYRPGAILPTSPSPSAQATRFSPTPTRTHAYGRNCSPSLAHPEGHTGVITAPSTPPPLTVR